MSDGPLSRTEIRCTLIWRLARRHAWANWIPEDDLIGGLPSDEHGRARSVAEELRSASYIAYKRDRGYKIAHAHVDDLAMELRDTCGYSEFRIEATLSHFDGF